MIVGVVGRSQDPTNAMCSIGAGKDTVADMLVQNHGFVKMGIADPLKRFCQEVYGFTDTQLWGPSSERSKPDERYPREHTYEGGPQGRGYVCLCCGHDRGAMMRDGSPSPLCYLTPRYALQTLGTAWGRHCWSDTWITLGIMNASTLLRDSGLMYTVAGGLTPKIEQCPQGEFERDGAPKDKVCGVVFSDVRFKNEAEALKRRGGKLLLVHRKVKSVDATEEDRAHASENDLNEYDVDSNFWDDVVFNYGSMVSLQQQTERAFRSFE